MAHKIAQMDRAYGHGEHGIISDMERFFNIAGPCNPAKHYTLPAMARLPEVIREKAYDQDCRPLQ